MIWALWFFTERQPRGPHGQAVGSREGRAVGSRQGRAVGSRLGWAERSRLGRAVIVVDGEVAAQISNMPIGCKTNPHPVRNSAIRAAPYMVNAKKSEKLIPHLRGRLIVELFHMRRGVVAVVSARRALSFRIPRKHSGWPGSGCWATGEDRCLDLRRDTSLAPEAPFGPSGVRLGPNPNELPRTRGKNVCSKPGAISPPFMEEASSAARRRGLSAAAVLHGIAPRVLIKNALNPA
jgi:hypothetical protein